MDLYHVVVEPNFCHRPQGESIMTSTTHVSFLTGGGTNRQGDTGSSVSITGTEMMSRGWQGCCVFISLGGLCFCCDYLPLQGKDFLWGSMEKCGFLPSALISTPASSWVSLEDKCVCISQGISTVWTVIIPAYSRAPTFWADVPLHRLYSITLLRQLGLGMEICFIYALNTVTYFHICEFWMCLIS